ncbi:MAG: hypothetical protein WBD13_16680 [Burkholderiaceae bacterium]
MPSQVFIKKVTAKLTQNQQTISLQDWKSIVDSRPDLTETGQSGSELRNQDGQLLTTLTYKDGRISATDPGEEAIREMFQIAKALRGVVEAEDGLPYGSLGIKGQKNGIELFEATDFFRPFPRPDEVFAGDIDKHAEHFLPLASVDLSQIKPGMDGVLHFVAPVEPYDGVVGETTTQFHDYLCRDNWVAYRVTDSRYEYAGDWRLFQKDRLAGFYEAVRLGYQRGAVRFAKNGRLFGRFAEEDAAGKITAGSASALVYHLGGQCSDANWANMGSGVPVERFGEWVDEYGDPRPHVRPVTEDGRPFEFIGEMDVFNYLLGEGEAKWAGACTLLLFYDPKEKIALTTFDWS